MELPTHLPLDVLTDDGDVLEIDETHRLRLVIKADDVPTCEKINDAPDCYGTVEWVRRGYSGRCERPESFDGRARIMVRAGNHQLWWQPPTDVRTPDAIAAVHRTVRDLLETGFLLVGLVHERKCDVGDWHEVSADYVGGVDAIYPELVGDLLCDLT
jgi:hypothetical protein